MCGICGIIGKSDRETLNAMVTAMRHRGPDDHGEFFSENVCLGMARLSIIDTSRCGHQPMSNDTETVWIVYNGETYNFPELRRSLEDRGYKFHSTSDTEVILHLYEEFGDECVTRMRGMFAFAIFDARDPKKPRLLIARDPVGIKPLLYSQNQNGLIFASEMKSLLSSRLIAPDIDPEAMRLLLTYGSVPQPLTLISGVRMLLPGHRLIFENGRLIDETYWSLEDSRGSEKTEGRTYDELRLLLRSSLERCIREQMISDVPIGAFLSGGIDSSLLVALMARESEIPVRTFSVGFESGSYDTDESDDAERIAKFIGTDHTRVLITGCDVKNRIVHFASSLDQPSIDGLNSYFVSFAASRYVKVAISGTGGDELFAGYPWYISLSKAEVFFKDHPLIGSLLTYTGRYFGAPVFNRLMVSPVGRLIDISRGQRGLLSRFSRTFVIFSARDVTRLLSGHIRASGNAGREYALDFLADERCRDCSVLQKIMTLTLRTYTRNQLLRDIDAVSMAHSIEVRVPLLDHKLAELAFSLPDDSKLGDPRKIPSGSGPYRSTGAKRILIDSCRDLLPMDLDLQKKRGFGMPFEMWLNGPLKEILEDALSRDSVTKRGFFNAEVVEDIRREFERGKSGWTRVWLLMIVELWAREVLDTAPSGEKHEQGR